MLPNSNVMAAYDSIAMSVEFLALYGNRSLVEPAEPASAALYFAPAELQEMTAEVKRLQAERDGWQAQRAQIMGLLSSSTPERILHDLRNVLNERDLYRSLANLDD